MQTPNVFTIPPDAPFLRTLADSILSGELVGSVDAAELGDATIYLPTRRAGRALSRILADRAGRALVTPRIVPLGDADDEPPGRIGRTDLPPAIPSLERRLILTRLVQAWSDKMGRDPSGPDGEGAFVASGSPAAALALAADLEGLMDALAIEGIDWSALRDVVDVEHSRYFALTLDFVRIAQERWPDILAERGASDPSRRRTALLDAETHRLAAEQPARPVIAAGSTGSIPATARLLGAIARLPRGAVVLPGLDLDLDEEGWSALGGNRGSGGREGVHGHPQFILRRLLEEHLQVPRASIRPLGRAAGSSRRRLLSEVMRPAETTDRWAAADPAIRAALACDGSAGLALVEAADEREEGLAIAIALRETLATPGRTACLVTPDRALARRVAAELRRWNVAIADSAGMSLADTEAGLLARLVAEAAASNFHPGRILALLAHGGVRLGLDRAAVVEAAAALEIGVLRGPAPRQGLGGLATALDLRRREVGRRSTRAVRRLAPADWDLARDLVRRLADAFAGFDPKGGDRELDLVALARPHAATVDRLRAGPPDDRAPDPGQQALSGLFDDLALLGDGAPIRGRFAEYPALFATLARDRVLAPEAEDAHPRLRILGLLEARLVEVDRVILGGLDETVWPPTARSDALLNRPMRQRLGLTPPERRIGQTAHDFTQALGIHDAIITRSRKRDGKPTVPSRFLERMQAFAGQEVWTGIRARGRRYLSLAAALDRPRPVAPIMRPNPQPGAGRFPRRLSVTEIEVLVRDPYAIFARHVLGIEPLDPIAMPPSAADRGTILHDVIAGFATAHPHALPSDAEVILSDLGARRFRDIADAYPELHALWWPAFQRLVPAYLEWERERREGLASLAVESAGAIELPVGAGPDAFRLTGRADRVERDLAGGAAIVDFKTGRVPSNREVAVGFSPQLTLEAAMLMRGGFPGGAAADLPRLEYVKLGGRAVLDPLPMKPPQGDRRSLPEIVDEHWRGLVRMVARYAQEGSGYLSRPYPQFARTFAPYDHLARVKEWSATAGVVDEVPE